MLGGDDVYFVMFITYLLLVWFESLLERFEFSAHDVSYEPHVTDCEVAPRRVEISFVHYCAAYSSSVAYLSHSPFDRKGPVFASPEPFL